MTDKNPEKIVVICGPTAVGKTGFAIEMAGRFDGQIVGADSMQIYRLMNIGTAKPTVAERTRAVHHMVDFLDPTGNIDAAAYAEQAGNCISGIVAQTKTPLVVGGTGLYIKALVHGLTEAAPADPAVRDKLRRELDASGAPRLHERLLTVDPESAQRIHPNDSYRILRALEVFEITGRSISRLHIDHGFSTERYKPLYIGLTMPRDQLYARINARVDRMLKEGFLEEVRSLLDSGYGGDLKSMQSLGYRHMVDYIQGRLTWEEAARTLKRDHRRYAKRQLTWFGAIPDMNWLAPDQISDGACLISQHMGAGIR